MRRRVTDYLESLQETIVAKLETYGHGKFRRERWTREQGGGGLACTYLGANDDAIEKAGVNISTIHGILPAAAVKQMSTAHAALEHVDASLPFFTTGLSLILHPRHPRIPGVHANYRYFEVLDDDGAVLAWWFGAITDMTPAYVDVHAFSHFHATLKSACDGWCDAIYPPLKASCDNYLYIPHRQEHRGIGGIRFDDMDADAVRALLNGRPDVSEETIVRLSTPEALFELLVALGNSFLPSYVPILEKHINDPIVPAEKRWQLLRRGRAVEFNLVVDRGTKFGLAAPGIIVENVLVGMPPEARWEYCTDVTAQDEEAEMVKILREPRNWID